MFSDYRKMEEESTHNLRTTETLEDEVIDTSVFEDLTDEYLTDEYTDEEDWPSWLQLQHGPAWKPGDVINSIVFNNKK